MPESVKIKLPYSVKIILPSSVGTTVTEYTFSEWNKTLSNIASPTDFQPVFTSEVFTGYKVTFMDSDGKEELYSHYFKEGTTPTYPYEAPWSYDDENVTMFFGWSKSLASIAQETTVTMNTRTISRAQNGEYPQTKVTDQETINALKKLPQPTDGNYLQYCGERYELSNSNYYKVEPIQWRYLSQDNDSVLLLAEKTLDSRRWNTKLWLDADDNGYCANNYKRSSIREWLNGEFLEKAFADDSLIKTTAVDNSVSSTGESENPYVCETTNDKVFLLSYQEATDPNLGFGENKNRVSTPTDYSGILSGVWWSRSPLAYANGRYARVVGRVGGYLGPIDASEVNSGSGVRPAIRMNLD